MKTIISLFVLGLSIITAQATWAGCEGSIVQGSHTALKKKEAKLGAMEEAIDACYPGVATKLGGHCDKLTNAHSSMLFQCVHEVSCNTCDDDLTRKYDALN